MIIVIHRASRNIKASTKHLLTHLWSSRTQYNMSCHESTVKLTEDTFGQVKDQHGETKPVRRFTWTNSNKIKVQLITYGGHITAIEVPDKTGKVEDVVIGFDTIDGYLKPDNQYFGSTVGRVANRIKHGDMIVEGVKYKLAVNNGPNHLHGGVKGFDKVLWEAHVVGKKVVLSYLSKHLEENYPGDLVVNVTYELTEDNEFKMDYQAMATKVTPVNLANHAYFNLAGDGKGRVELMNHVVTINADKITEIDSTLIPTGKFLNVAETVFDLRVPRKLADIFSKTPNSAGFDHNFCITRASKQHYTFNAKVVHPATGRVLEVYSDQPGIQFYTGMGMPEGTALKGKHGPIQKNGAFCLETQNYPDAVNQKHFPSPLLHPGQIYHHAGVYKFDVEH